MNNNISLLIDRYNNFQCNYFFSALAMYTDGMDEDEISRDIESGSIINAAAPFFAMVEELQPDGSIKAYIKGYEEKEILQIIKNDTDFINELLNDIDALLKVLKAIHA